MRMHAYIHGDEKDCGSKRLRTCNSLVTSSRGRAQVSRVS